LTQIGCRLAWEYQEDSNIYFEIYRNHNNKMACNDSSLIGITSEREFLDENLKSGTIYFYYIRAVHKLSKIKSPFAPKVKFKTKLESSEFSKTIFPKRDRVGYVAERSPEANRGHFGINSLKIGVSIARGISYGVMEFDLSSIPKDAIVIDAHISLYPLNRVSAKIEKYGEWSVTILDSDTISNIKDFEQVHRAVGIQSVGRAIPSEQLTQGIWSHWRFDEVERLKLQEQIERGEVIFKISGPTKLPRGRDSQIMVFDLGYGTQGGGLHYRPSIDIKYTTPPKEITVESSNVMTISEDDIIEGRVSCGFDKDGEKIYGFLSFDLSELPDMDRISITEAWIEIKNSSIIKRETNVRYNVEFIDLEEFSYQDIKNRERIEYIGYEISSMELRKKRGHSFIFDSYSILALEEKRKAGKEAKFIIRPTTVDIKRHLIDWDSSAKLRINYIDRKRRRPPSPKNLNVSIHKGRVKLTWDRVSGDIVGYYVVRNRWRTPSNPFDGVKLYAGKDNYTYDVYGSTKIDKYYAVFSYDDVPNYSAGTSIRYGV